MKIEYILTARSIEWKEKEGTIFSTDMDYAIEGDVNWRLHGTKFVLTRPNSVSIIFSGSLEECKEYAFKHRQDLLNNISHLIDEIDVDFGEGEGFMKSIVVKAADQLAQEVMRAFNESRPNLIKSEPTTSGVSRLTVDNIGKMTDQDFRDALKEELPEDINTAAQIKKILCFVRLRIFNKGLPEMIFSGEELLESTINFLVSRGFRVTKHGPHSDTKNVYYPKRITW